MVFVGVGTKTAFWLSVLNLADRALLGKAGGLVRSALEQRVPRALRHSEAALHLKDGPIDPCPRCVAPGAIAPESLKQREEPCGGVGGGGGTSEGEENNTVKVFSYGSNMGCAKLGALGVFPVSSRAAVLPGWCLRFATWDGLPTTSQEPAFATIVPCQQGCVHGELQQIRNSDLMDLHRTEPGYDFHRISGAQAYDKTPAGEVWAYVASARPLQRAPSERYAGLVYCSANDTLAAAYLDQMECEMKALDMAKPDCSKDYKPMAKAPEDGTALRGTTGVAVIPAVLSMFAMFFQLF